VTTIVASPSIERLAAYVLERPKDEPFAGELRSWLAGSARFRGFVESNRDKVRKKLRGAAEVGARGDVRAELEVAFRLLADRRLDLSFEAYGAGRRGPDFTVAFRASHRFNLEVTRPRLDDPDRPIRDRAAAAAGALLAKLRQLPADAPNALLVVAKITPWMDDGANASVVQPYNTAIASVVQARAATGKHVIAVDMYAAFTANPNFKTAFMSDFLHPNDAGYVIMGDVWYAAIQSYLRAP